MLEVGHEAPDFTLPSQHGESITLSDFRGDKNVVLVFYPWAFTGVCTGELCVLRDRMLDFDNDNTITLAVSCDTKFSLRVFAESEGYGFSLLSDHWPHGEVAKNYGVFVEDVGVAKRGTFVIDKAGIVRWSVVHSIGQARDADEYARVLDKLRSE